MSGLNNITYATLVNTVKDWIKSNCVNITNYAGMSAAVKNGYSYQVGSSGTSAYVETSTAYLSSPLSQIDSSVVDTDMNNFLTSIGAINYLNYNISDPNFYTFINDLISFCCTKLAYITNQTNNTNTSVVTYLIYSTNNTYNSKIDIISYTEEDYLIYAEEANKLLTNLISLIKQNIRVISCRYSYSINGSR